jgi:hypothetical protein
MSHKATVLLTVLTANDNILPMVTCRNRLARRSCSRSAAKVQRRRCAAALHAADRWLTAFAVFHIVDLLLVYRWLFCRLPPTRTSINRACPKLP